MANNLNLDLMGKDVLIKKHSFGENFQDLTWRVALVTGGFGAYADKEGGMLAVYFYRDGQEEFWEGHHLERLATGEEVEAAQIMRRAKEKEQA